LIASGVGSRRDEPTFALSALELCIGINRIDGVWLRALTLRIT
jgi:hypothetical protein